MGRLVGVIGTYAVWAILQVIVVEVGRVGLAKLRLRHGEVAIERESERGRDDGCDVHRVQHGGSEVPIGGVSTRVLNLKQFSQMNVGKCFVFGFYCWIGTKYYKRYSHICLQPWRRLAW